MRVFAFEPFDQIGELRGNGARLPPVLPGLRCERFETIVAGFRCDRYRTRPRDPSAGLIVTRYLRPRHAVSPSLSVLTGFQSGSMKCASRTVIGSRPRSEVLKCKVLQCCWEKRYEGGLVYR